MSYLIPNPANQTQVSGQNVVVFLSGSVNSVRISNDAGTTIVTVLDPDVDTRSVANNALNVLGYTYGFVDEQNQWARLRVTASGQGVSDIPYRLVVAFSGDPVSISGQTVVTSISGLNTNISGQVVRISGSVISIGEGGQVVNVGQTNSDGISVSDVALDIRSRLYGYDIGNVEWDRVQVKANESLGNCLAVSEIPVQATIVTDRVTITNSSGGTTLPNKDCGGEVFLQNESGNNTMNVGGSNAGEFPNSTNGFSLFAGESMTIKIRNTDDLAVWAATSGQRIRTLITR